MSDETSGPDDVLGFLAEERRDRRDPEEHPSPETLTAYQANELSQEEDERIQSHLATCRHCTAMLLEFEEFLQPAEVAPAADFEAAADWRKLRARLRAPKRRLTIAMAAALFLAVLGISFYALSRGPEKTLEPLNSYRGQPESVEVVELPVTLLLKSPVKSPYPEYRADLRDSHGSLVKQFFHLQETSSFDLELRLWRWALDPGEYRVKLLGVKGQEADSVGEYAFKVKR